MKAASYTHNWDSKTSEEQEMLDKFGVLLHRVSTAGSYEVAETNLFKKGNKYYWLEADGCSCWEGEYSGFELTKAELMKLAIARANDPDPYGEPDHDKLMGMWVVENLSINTDI